MSKTISKGYISDKINGIKVNSSIKCNADNFTNKDSREIKFIVMHYTGNKKDTAKANANYFATGGREASAHFFVDNSNIYQSVELRDVAWHCGTMGTYYHTLCRNNNSIGIEMCCTAGNYKISDKTIKNSAYLCAYLCEMIGVKASEVDTYVLRHYDITHKTCPAQMVSNAKEWKEFKDMVKKILKGEDKKKTTTKTTSTTSKTSTVLTTGAKLKLSKVALYASSDAKTKSSTLSGIYYVWSKTAVNKKVRITNSSSNVGKKNQITGWISVSNAEKSLVKTTTQTIKIGSTVKVKSGAKSYEGGNLKSYVYTRNHKVKQINGDRVVITYLGIVVGAVKKSDLTFVK